MAQVPATSYESTSLGDVAEFTIPFPFLSRAEVFVTVDGAAVPFTWINDGLVQLSATPELGAVVRRYRSTTAYVPLHQFSTGVPFLPRYVDRDFKQTLYAVQESVNDTAGTAAQALATAEESLLVVQGAFDIIDARTRYIDLGPYGPGLIFTSTSQVFRYLGEFYAPGPAIELSPDYVTTGIGVAEIANFRSVGDAVLRQDLAAEDGAERVGRGAGTVETALDALEADVAALQLVDAEYVRPSDNGAVGDGVADDTAAVLATIQDGRPIYWGDDSKVYRITAMVSHTLARSAIWLSNGATIKVDAPSAIHRAINITSPGYDVYSSGKLSIDCNLKSYNGLYLYNATSFADCRIDDLFVHNVYRSGTTFTGGDGIWIRGAFRNVLLVRPDVRNVRMAIGAGISGSQGIAGITVSSAGIGLAPQEVTILHPYIDGVYSEDATYMVDQDGIRVFGEEDLVGETLPLESHFLISGGKIRNCRGRSIKSQMEFGTIDGVQITRDSTGLSLMNGAGTMPEIDFQVGGGLIRNVELKYKGSVPNRVVNFSGVRTAGKLGVGCVARDIRISLSGGTDLPSFASIVTFEAQSSSYNICDIYYSGSRNFGANFVNVTNDIDGRTVLLSLENIQARVTSSFRFVNKTAAIGTVRAVGRNIHNIANTTTFLVSAGGTTQTLLEGINVGVSL